MRKFLTLTPFNVTTEQGRSDERYRLVVLSMVANVLSRGAAMVVMVLTVSLTIPYLGAERFGVWMTIASFAGMLSFLDLGVGNALANRVSHVAAKNDPTAMRQTISGGLVFLLVIGFMVGILLFSLSHVLPWQKIIKVKEDTVSVEVQNAIKVFSILFGLSLFSNGIQRVFAGLQQAFYSHLVSLSGSIFSLLFLWVATTQEARISYLLLATLGIQLIANLFLLVILKRRNLVQLKDMWINLKIESRYLFSAGGLFFILQIGTMVGWGADSLIIASSLGAGQVAIFNIVQRLFQFISQPLSVMNSPLWGAYADAHARGDKKFIEKTLFKSIFLTGTASLIGGFVFLYFGNTLIKLWSTEMVVVPFELILVFFIWTVIETIGNSFAMMLNGCSIVGMQVTAVLIFICLVLPMKFLLIEFGLHYLIISTIVAYLISVPLFYIAFKKDKVLNLFKSI